MMAESNSEDPDDDPRVAQAVLTFLLAQDQGSPLDPEVWLAKYPEDIRAELREVVAGLAVLGSPRSPVVIPSRRTPVANHFPDFGRYTGLEHIASGGMGAIYRGVDTDLGRTIAVKVIHAHLAREPEKVLRFQEEAQVASQLQHPSIAPVHEVGIIAGNPPRPFFTMRLIEGQTLGEAIERHRTKPSDQGRETLLRYFIAVCNAVAYAHSRQILHRDLKPSNVMVGPYGDVQVMDWGLSKNLSGQQPTDLTNAGENRLAPRGRRYVRTVRSENPAAGSAEGGVRGTPAYMSMEQANGQEVGPRSDVFGLGAILCEILTGSPPYLGASWQEVWDKARSANLTEAFSRLDSCGEPVELAAIAPRLSGPGCRPQAGLSRGGRRGCQ